MNKTELVAAIATKTDLSKSTVDTVLKVMEEVVVDEAKKGSVVKTGLGKFEVKERAARNGINPKTKERIKIPAKKVLTFKLFNSSKNV